MSANWTSARWLLLTIVIWDFIINAQTQDGGLFDVPLYEPPTSRQQPRTGEDDAFTDEEMLDAIKEGATTRKEGVQHSDEHDDLWSQIYDPDMFEGDIATPGLTAENAGSFAKGLPIQTIPKSRPDGRHRAYTAVTSRYLVWPDATVPYKISRGFNPDEIYIIYEAFREIESQSCVRFISHSNQKDYMHFIQESGCWSSVGKQGGRQEISLGRGCVKKGVIMHELMHVMGFFHEQSRHDRDNHVVIHWANIWPDSKDQFHKFKAHEAETFNTAYDYDSITHYGPLAFSYNLLPTIEARVKGVRIGQRDHLSEIDVKRINRLYLCDNEWTFRLTNPSDSKSNSKSGSSRRPNSRPRPSAASLGGLFQNRKPSTPAQTTSTQRPRPQWTFPPVRSSSPSGFWATRSASTQTRTQPPPPPRSRPKAAQFGKRSSTNYFVCRDTLANCKIIASRRDICSDSELVPFCLQTCGVCPPNVNSGGQEKPYTRIPNSGSGNNQRGTVGGSSWCKDGEISPSCDVLKDKGYCSSKQSTVTGRYIHKFCSKTCGYCR